MEEKRTKDHPLVSIVTVVLNAKGTVEAALQSVQDQSYRHFEQIVVDGGSTDGTLEVLEEHKGQIDQLIHGPDEGIYDAMNKGIRQASGELIGTLNADDRYFPRSLERAVECYQQEMPGIVHGAIEVRFPDGTPPRINHGSVEELPYKASVNHPSCFIHRSVHERIGLYDTRYRLSADHDLLLRAYRNGVRFGYVEEALVSYLYGGASYSCKSDLETYRILKEHGTGHHKECLKRYAKCVLKKGVKRMLGKRI